MINKLKTLIGVVVLSGAVSTNAYAATLSTSSSIKSTTNDSTFWQNITQNKMGNWDVHLKDLLHPVKEITMVKGETNADSTLLSTITAATAVVGLTHINSAPVLAPVKAVGAVAATVINQVLPDDASKSDETKSDEGKVQVPKAEPVENKPTEDTANPPAEKIEPVKPVELAESAVAEAKAEETKENDSVEKVTPQPEADNPTKEITVKATAYTASCEGCSGITATGVNIKDNPNEKVIAVDPDVIPLGSKVYVEGFGEAIAADTGGAIKGNRIDIFIPSEQDAIEFGVKELKVKILN